MIFIFDIYITRSKKKIEREQAKFNSMYQNAIYRRNLQTFLFSLHFSEKLLLNTSTTFQIVFNLCLMRRASNINSTVESNSKRCHHVD